MVYHIHPTPRFSSETPSLRNTSTPNTPRFSTSSNRSGVMSPTSAKSSPSALKRALNGMTEEYWSNPSPLYTPRGSMDMGRPTAAAATSSPASPAAVQQKKSFVAKMKSAASKSVKNYWGNPEMNAMYGGAVAMKV